MRVWCTHTCDLASSFAHRFVRVWCTHTCDLASPFALRFVRVWCTHTCDLASPFADADFAAAGFLYKTAYVVLATSVIRHRYYFAWKLGTRA